MPRRFAGQTNRTNLDRLTSRWRARHDLRREGDPFRPRANPGREALARRGFPYQDVTPADYVAEHGPDMAGFTYDDESYADVDLDAWIVEVGELLREQREGGAKPKRAATTEPAASESEPAAGEPEPAAVDSEPAAAQPKAEAKPRSKPKVKPKADG